MNRTLFISLFIVSLTSYVYGAFLSPKIFNAVPPGVKIICQLTPNNLCNRDTLQCADQATLRIITAVFGQIDPVRCRQNHPNLNTRSPRINCDESIQTTQEIKRLCNGRVSCDIDFNSNNLNIPDNCPREFNEYLNITYQCVTPRLPFRPFANLLFGFNRPGAGILGSRQMF